MKKKVSIVGTVGLPACYGGWETLVHNITLSKSENVSYEIYCSKKAYEKKLAEFNGAKLTYLPFSANGVSSIIYDIASLVHCWKTKPDVVLILGVSGCVFLPIFRFFSKSKVITNVDGIEWKRNKWSRLAKAFLKFSESIAVKFSDTVVADNQGIYEYLESAYSIKSEIIAYGGEHALTSDVLVNDSGYFLSICRIEPENNIEMILDSFSQSGEKLKFVGNWQSSTYGIELKSKFEGFKNIEIIEPIYELSKLFELRRSCTGYIHGHSVGGTNPSLVEIMHFGKQIYNFDCVFNRYTTENHALYFKCKKSLQEIICENKKVSSNSTMKEIAENRYTWQVVTSQYEYLY